MKIIFRKNSPPSFESLLLANRINLFKTKKIQLILDVGANAGQYAISILSNYKCKIISFEPIKSAYNELVKQQLRYQDWHAHNIALGNENKQETINVSENSYSSSILALKPETLNYDQRIGYVDKQEITVKRLDDIWDSLNINAKNILLKIDTQGYEDKVLDGCTGILKNISGIQVELSVVQLYDNEPLFDKMCHKIMNYGFDLYIIEPGYSDPESGKLLQLEAVFFRPKA